MSTFFDDVELIERVIDLDKQDAYNARLVLRYAFETGRKVSQLVTGRIESVHRAKAELLSLVKY